MPRAKVTYIRTYLCGPSRNSPYSISRVIAEKGIKTRVFSRVTLIEYKICTVLNAFAPRASIDYNKLSIAESTSASSIIKYF